MIKVESMNKEINKLLEQYQTQVNDAVDDVINDVSGDCVSELKQTSPKNTGQYSRLWRYKIVENRFGKYKSVIYNYQYQLTHLLEKGHMRVTKTGEVLKPGARAKVHIAPAEEHAIQDYETNLRKVIDDIR